MSGRRSSRLKLVQERQCGIQICPSRLTVCCRRNGVPPQVSSGLAMLAVASLIANSLFSHANRRFMLRGSARESRRWSPPSWSTSPIAFGRPGQTIQGNPEQPDTIQLQWAATPEWLPSVTVNQQVNHITTSTDRDEGILQLIDGQARHLKLRNATWLTAQCLVNPVSCRVEERRELRLE
jgi:hypothetical protein